MAHQNLLVKCCSMRMYKSWIIRVLLACTLKHISLTGTSFTTTTCSTLYVIRFPFFFIQNTVEGRIAYFPVVGRLHCDSSSADHRGFWELLGFGLLGIYKSDWTKIGGEWNLVCYRD